MRVNDTLSQEAEQRKLSSSVFEMLSVLERTNPVLLQVHLEI